MTQATGASRKPRDTRIDLIRGFALATIYINHVPGTVWEHFTTRNFGFSDAAEAFVMISGVSAALAYGRYFGPGPWWQGLWRCWGRAWMLYLVQMLISVVVLGLIAAVLRFAQTPEMMGQDNFQALIEDPIGVFIGLPLLLHQFGYINILTLYIVLILAAPLILWGGRREPLITFACALGLWLFAGIARVNLPTYPGAGQWFLNPFSWQLIFVIGALIGLRLAEGERLVPVRPWITALALAYAILAALWVQIDAVREAGNQVMVWLANLGLPRVITNFNKTYLELPRLLHILSLAWLVSVLPGFARWSGSRWFEPLSVMGRQALPIFALGTVLSFAARAVLTIDGAPSAALEAAVIWGGLALLVGFAYTREWALRHARMAR